MNFNWRIFRETLPDFLEATGVTVRFGIVAIIIAIFWGILIGSINFRKVKGVSLLTRAYVCFFRETPLLVQIYFLFYGLSRLMKVSPSVIGVIALVLNDGAFIAEIIRGALQSLDMVCFITAPTCRPYKSKEHCLNCLIRCSKIANS